MKKLWNSFKVAFAMFSRIPVPRADWTRENMQYMFCFFPVIGTVIGGLEVLIWLFLGHFGYSSFFSAMVMVMIPVLVTGGIHIDGLLDTSDAMSSWREKDKRLEILKDSHAGAFAIIVCCANFLVFAGSFSEISRNRKAVFLAALVFVLSRTLSGTGVLTLPKANQKGTVAEFSRNAQEKTVLTVLYIYLALLLAVMLLIDPLMGACCYAAAVLVFFNYRRMALKYFGGTTGDLSGFFLCTCEVTCAFVLAFVSHLQCH